MNLAYIADCLGAMKTPVQLVKHFGEVLEKNIKYPLIAQRKYDGVYCLVIRIGQELGIFSRTGKAFYFECLSTFMDGKLLQLPEGVYIGELCSDELTLEELSGYTSPNRKKAWDIVGTDSVHDKGYIMFHDYLPIDAFLDGCSDTRYGVRYIHLSNRLDRAGLNYYIIKNLFIFNQEGAEAHANYLISRGREGVVLKHPDADWVAGHKGWRSMKIVRGVHLDLLCCGVVYGQGKRADQIAALEFTYKGHKFKADLGKGWTDARRNSLTLAHTESREGYTCSVTDCNTGEVFKNPVGLIWEVKALDISSTGKALRLPKVVRVREDKDTPDDQMVINNPNTA